MQQNYNGYMPQQTQYGFNGAGAKKNSKVPMMMAAGAGLVGGAVIGVGSYYAYTQMSRRNWFGDYRDRSWCTPNYRPGDNMICSDCYRKYNNQCSPMNGCYQRVGGCGYTVPEDTVRDDVMVAGFVPGDSPSPWTIKITKITGPGFTEAEICPKEQPDTANFDETWVKASTVNLGLYMTLTEMDPMEVPAPPTRRRRTSSVAAPPRRRRISNNEDQDASAAYHSGMNFIFPLMIFLVVRHFCRQMR